MRRHDTDVVSLVAGLLFLGVVGLWATVEFHLLGLPGLGVAIPVLLVMIGLVGMAASLAKLRGGCRHGPSS